MSAGGEEQARLRAAARTWMAQDPDEATRNDTAGMLAGNDDLALRDHFGSRRSFGTAGIRGPMGPGPNRINRLLVRQTAAGIARTMLDDGVTRSAVVGHDARTNSERFADDVGEVFEAHGLAVIRPDGAVPTPVVPWAVRTQALGAGVMVTASHNPAGDNGLKVYWADGAQIAPPIDARIATAIDHVASDRRVLPQPGSGSIGTRRLLIDRYLSDATAQVGPAGDDALNIVTTALHGVAGGPLHRLLDSAGFTRVTAVPQQEYPDPTFPTVAVPNPERAECLSAAIELATELTADVVLALDPDGDRLAVALPDDGGHWHRLDGNELGWLLGWWALQRSRGMNDRMMVTTMVSSQMLGKMAAATGVHYAETLTGFKWLCRPALAHPEWFQLLAYEEALGYAIGPNARDKDGLLAGLAFCDLTSRLFHQGVDPLALLDRLALRHGVHVTSQVRRPMPDHLTPVELIDAIAGHPPASLGGRTIESVDRPDPSLIRFLLAGGDRVGIRCSGTEPTVKAYLEVVETVGTSTRVADGVLRAARRRAGVRIEWVEHEIGSLLDRLVTGAG